MPEHHQPPGNTRVQTPASRHTPVAETAGVEPSSAAPALDGPLSAPAVLRLQATVGNRAVQRMLQPTPITRSASPAPIIHRDFFDDVLEAVGLSDESDTEEEEADEAEAEHETDYDYDTTGGEDDSDADEADEGESEESAEADPEDVMEAIGLGETDDSETAGAETEEEHGTDILSELWEAAGFGSAGEADTEAITEESEGEEESIWDSIGDFIDEVVEAVEGALFRWTSADEAKIASQTQPNVLTEFQAGRIERAVNALDDDGYDRFRIVLENTTSDMEFAFVCKALAAGHTIEEVEEFAMVINGMGERWMIRNLNVVDESTEIGETNRGIQQQFGNSCGPTSMQLIHAQADPVYALALHSAGPLDAAVNDAKTNPENAPNQAMADEQNAVLQSHADAGTGNAATDRSNPTGGAWVESDMNDLVGATGLTFQTKIIGTDITLNDAIDVLKTNLARGIHVPIVVGGSVGDTAHYVVALNWAQNRIQIHDVWTGDTIWRTEEDLRNSTLNLPSNHTMLTAVDEPTEAD